MLTLDPCTPGHGLTYAHGPHVNPRPPYSPVMGSRMLMGLMLTLDPCTPVMGSRMLMGLMLTLDPRTPGRGLTYAHGPHVNPRPRTPVMGSRMLMGLMLGVGNISGRVQMYDGCCSVR